MSTSDTTATPVFSYALDCSDGYLPLLYKIDKDGNVGDETVPLESLGIKRITNHTVRIGLRQDREYVKDQQLTLKPNLEERITRFLDDNCVLDWSKLERDEVIDMDPMDFYESMDKDVKDIINEGVLYLDGDYVCNFCGAGEPHRSPYHGKFYTNVMFKSPDEFCPQCDGGYDDMLAEAVGEYLWQHASYRQQERLAELDDYAAE